MNYVLSVVTLSIACSITYSAECKYKKYSPQHTGCKTANPTCSIMGNSMGNIMANSEKKMVLHLHNRQRNRLAQGQGTKGSQPKASDMKEMEWDNDLADLAQKHAEQCVFEHDCSACRKTDDFSSVGQNIFLHKTRNDTLSKNWAEAINYWYSEVHNFPRNGTVMFDDNVEPTVPYYIHIIAASTCFMGCGTAQYTSKEPKMKLEILYVCNYAPGINIINSSVYDIGEPCTKCPDQHVCSTRYRGLCRKLL